MEIDALIERLKEVKEQGYPNIEGTLVAENDYRDCVMLITVEHGEYISTKEGQWYN